MIAPGRDVVSVSVGFAVTSARVCRIMLTLSVSSISSWYEWLVDRGASLRAPSCSCFGKYAGSTAGRWAGSPGSRSRPRGP